MVIGAVPHESQADPEQKLLDRHKRGDQSAFEEIFRAYEQRVYRFVLRMVRDVADAEDITAETFARAYEGLLRVNEGSKMLPWLYHVSRNLCRDLGRRKTTRKTYSYDAAIGDGQSPGQSADQIPDPSPEPLGLAISQELREVVEAATQALPDWQREVITLFYLEDKDITAVAKALGIKEGTVKSRLSRARESLRKSLGAYMEAFGS